MSRSGVRCAEITRASLAIPSSSSVCFGGLHHFPVARAAHDDRHARARVAPPNLPPDDAQHCRCPDRDPIGLRPSSGEDVRARDRSDCSLRHRAASRRAHAISRDAQRRVCGARARCALRCRSTFRRRGLRDAIAGIRGLGIAPALGFDPAQDEHPRARRRGGRDRRANRRRQHRRARRRIVWSPPTRTGSARFARWSASARWPAPVPSCSALAAPRARSCSD